MAKLELEHIKKIFDKSFTAVHDFSLTIQDNEFIVFVGPSGCGKSTTLRMIAGLESISSGTLKIDGEIVNDFQPKDRNIAMVFQNYALYPHLSVFENMAFSLRLKKHPKVSQNEIYEKVVEVANTLGIKDLLNRKPRALSGGQRQRVAIGRAMVKEAKVFLMDEPLSNLDAKLRNQMRSEIILLRKKINSTFIYVTHDQTEAMTLGDRIVVMKDGYIQQVGTPQEVFEHPANLFVGEFIGAPKMNVFEASLSFNNNQYFISLFNKKIPISNNLNNQLLNNHVSLQDIYIGIRPEHIVLKNKESDSSFKGKLKFYEMMGSELHLHVLIDFKELIIRVLTIHLSEEERNNLLENETLFFEFESKALHLFDKESKMNLI